MDWKKRNAEVLREVWEKYDGICNNANVKFDDVFSEGQDDEIGLTFSIDDRYILFIHEDGTWVLVDRENDF